MNDTQDIRERLLSLWEQFNGGKITHTEARAHIGFARALLDSIKVEIAAAHLAANAQAIPPVELVKRNGAQITSRRKAS